MLAQESGITEVESLMRTIAGGSAPPLCDRIVREHLDSGGKRLRARLALACVEALGRPRSHGVGWAAACEILHNATLVHDDLQDGDRQRRGRPTTWVAHGMEQAVNAGDLLFMLQFLALAHVPVAGDVRWLLAEALAHGAATVIRGQAAELDLTRRGDVERTGYMAAIVGKTAALFELPVRGAAIVCGCRGQDVDAIVGPFRHLGVLFQMQDDVLDLFGDKGREAPGADIREGKISALVVEHLALHPGQRDWLLGVLRAPRDRTAAADVIEVTRRFREQGALRAVCGQIRTASDAARSDPRLGPWPALAVLMAEIVELVLQPIAHVLADVDAA